MSHLEHADDMAIISYSPEGLQRHLSTFARWCGNNFLQPNASKSWVMIFGAIPRTLPTFTVNGRKIGYTDCFCYVGVTFQSTDRNIFASHYTAKASTARRTGYTVLGIEAYIGDLPPKEGRLLYMACIDPHLISGADIIIDVDDKALAHLEKVQRAFLCRLLGLGAYSMRAPLFTELGLLPLRSRRLDIALRYLAGKQGYWMDVAYALQKLPVPIQLPPLPELSPEKCVGLAKSVRIAALKQLDAEVSASTRLYMLHDRREPLEDEPAKKITAVLRHYLVLVVNPKHRKALTRLL
ncbi:hypothetical protein FB451DRAFT_1213638, partial [Mycena latifolia]